MKKLNINDAGRMPLWQKDLEFIQEGLTEPLEALVGELGMAKDYFIITGCTPYKPDNNHIAMGRGWFYYGGRILPVRQLPPTSVASFTNPMVRLVPVTYANPAGARSFIRADQTSETVTDVWRDDYLQPSVVERSMGFSGGVRLGVGAWTLRDIIANSNESPWHQGSDGNMEYKRIGQMVVVRGYAPNVTTFSPYDKGFPAPLAGTVTLHVPYLKGHLTITINGNGEMYCRASDGQGELILIDMTYVAETPYRATDINTINDNISTNSGDR